MENMIENFGLSLDLYYHSPYNNEEYERDGRGVLRAYRFQRVAGRCKAMT